jgi:hypothetical protein
MSQKVRLQPYFSSQIRFFRGRFAQKAKKKFKKSKKTRNLNMTWYLFMEHISGNKSPMGSIEVPIDREYQDEEHINFPYIAIHFYGHGWPLK